MRYVYFFRSPFFLIQWNQNNKHLSRKEYILMIHRFMLVLFTFSTLVFAVNDARATVTDDVKKVVDQVVAIVSNKELKKPENEDVREQKLKSVIATIFDYNEMARLSLGKNWNGRTPAEKKEFVPLFESVLQRAYAHKIESYNNEKIVYLNETNDGQYAQVKSKVITPKGDEYSVNYRLKNKDGKWVVYDVVIEGVSLVANYRSQFDKIIREKGYDELVRKLKSRSGEIKGPK